MKLDNLPTRDKFQCLIFGSFKSGKSAGAFTFPRPCVMDFDRGIAVVRSQWWREWSGIKDPNSHIVEVEQFYDKKGKGGVPTGHSAFDSACKFFDHMMHKDRIETFDTWVIDSGTTLSDAAMTKAIVVLGPSGFKMSNTLSDAQKHGLVFPRIQDYGSERSMVTQFIDMVLDSNKHVVLVCHEKELTNDAGATLGIVPLLTGRGVQEIPLKFDEVYRLAVKASGLTVKRELQTTATALIKCGSRYGIPNGIEWKWDAIQKALKTV